MPPGTGLRMVIGAANTTGRCILLTFAMAIAAAGFTRMGRNWSCNRTRYRIVCRKRGACRRKRRSSAALQGPSRVGASRAALLVENLEQCPKIRDVQHREI